MPAKTKKKKRAPGGGRKPLPDDQKRVTMSASVAQGTKREIEARAKSAGVSIGVLLDRTFNASDGE